MVQPLQTAFEAIGERPLEVAATLRASPLDAFFTVAIPLSLPGFLTASILTFAHTVGEFGVILMIGGNTGAADTAVGRQTRARTGHASLGADQGSSIDWLMPNLAVARIELALAAI